MKNTVSYLLVMSLLFSLFSCTKKSERLLLAGSGWNKVVIINKETKEIEWEYPLEKGWECNSVSATAEGNILFSYGKGAKLIDPDKKELWDWKAEPGCEIQTASVLPDGKIILAQCGSPATVFILEKEGTLSSKTTFELPLKYPHSQFRQVTINKEGNYMVPVMGLSEVWEVTPNGDLLKTVSVAGNLFNMIQLNNGNWMVSCGDSHRYVELDYERGEIVSETRQNDLEGVTLFFVAQLLPTRQGGLYICNWQGHDKHATESNSPQVIELDAAGKMIWSLNDNHSFGMISAVSPI